MVFCKGTQLGIYMGKPVPLLLIPTIEMVLILWKSLVRRMTCLHFLET
jgi:hypothetical protein